MPGLGVCRVESRWISLPTCPVSWSFLCRKQPTGPYIAALPPLPLLRESHWAFLAFR